MTDKPHLLSESAPPPAAPRSNPYIGPRSFRVGERLYGRNREVEDLLDLLIAERIVLLYSPSGAGKTSLIQAALLPRLEAEGFRVMPLIRVNHPLSSTVEAGRNRYISSMLFSLEEGLPNDLRLPQDELASIGLEEYLESWHERYAAAEAARHDADGASATDDADPDDDLADEPSDGEVFIFDQFEEVLTVDPTDQQEKEGFFGRVGKLLRNRNRWVLFAMREDFVAGLDPYLRYIPTRCKTTYRLDLLDYNGARQAIQEPAAAQHVTFDDEAVQRLLRDLSRVRVQRADGTATERPGTYVEPVQLQVVCYRMWENLPPNANHIDDEYVLSLGDVDEALAAYYDDKVSLTAEQTSVGERKIREWVGENLITEQGLRAQVLLEAEQSAGLDNRAIMSLIDAHLLRGERRRGVTWLELSHDRLVTPVQQSNIAWFEAHLGPFQHQVTEWVKAGSPDELLLRGRLLAEAAQWADAHPDMVTELDRAFLSASYEAEAADARELAQAQALARAERQRAEERAQTAHKLQRQAKFLRLGLIVTLGTALLAIVLGWQALNSANQARREGDRAEQLVLTSAARAALTRGDPDEAMAFAISAVEMPGDLLPQTELIVSEVADQARTRRVFELPESQFSSVALSPDGTTVLAGTYDGSMLLWDVASGEQLNELACHGEAVLSVAWSPDGSLLATSSKDRTVCLWDAASRERLHVLRGHSSDINAVIFSPDGSLLASAGADWTARLWDVASGTQRGTPLVHEAPVTAIAFSPDGSLLATGSDDKIARLWDADTNRMLEDMLFEHIVSVTSIAFDPTGTQLLAGLVDGYIAFWDISSHEVLQETDFHQAAITGIAFDVANNHILTSSLDGALQVSDLETADILFTLNGHGAPVNDLAFDAASQQLISASDDGTLRLWDLKSPTLVGLFAVEDDIIQDAAISPDGTTLLVGLDSGAVQLWDIDTGDVQRTFEGHDRAVRSVLFSPDGELVLSYGRDGQVCTWDVASGEQRTTWDIPDASVFSMVLSPDGEQLLTGSADGVVRLWELDSGTLLHSFDADAGAVWDVAFKPSGDMIAAAANTGEVFLWSLAPDAPDAPDDPLAILSGHNITVWALAFHPVADLLITASGDGTLRMWELEEYTTTHVFDGHTDEVLSVAFNRRGDRVVSGASDGQVLMWRAETGQPVRHLRGHFNPVVAVHFRANRPHVLAGAEDGMLLLWRVDPPEEIVDWLQNNRYVPELACSQLAQYNLHSECRADDFDRPPPPPPPPSPPSR